MRSRLYSTLHQRKTIRERPQTGSGPQGVPALRAALTEGQGGVLGTVSPQTPHMLRDGFPQDKEGVRG